MCESRTEGEAKGIEIGRSETSINIARSMKDNNIPVEMIIKCTGLSSEAVERLWAFAQRKGDVSFGILHLLFKPFCLRRCNLRLSSHGQRLNHCSRLSQIPLSQC